MRHRTEGGKPCDAGAAHDSFQRRQQHASEHWNQQLGARSQDLRRQWHLLLWWLLLLGSSIPLPRAFAQQVPTYPGPPAPQPLPPGGSDPLPPAPSEPAAPAWPPPIPPLLPPLPIPMALPLRPMPLPPPSQPMTIPAMPPAAGSLDPEASDDKKSKAASIVVPVAVAVSVSSALVVLAFVFVCIRRGRALQAMQNKPMVESLVLIPPGPGAGGAGGAGAMSFKEEQSSTGRPGGLDQGSKRSVGGTAAGAELDMEAGGGNRPTVGVARPPAPRQTGTAGAMGAAAAPLAPQPNTSAAGSAASSTTPQQQLQSAPQGANAEGAAVNAPGSQQDLQPGSMAGAGDAVPGAEASQPPRPAAGTAAAVAARAPSRPPQPVTSPAGAPATQPQSGAAAQPQLPSGAAAAAMGRPEAGAAPTQAARASQAGGMNAIGTPAAASRAAAGAQQPGKSPAAMAADRKGAALREAPPGTRWEAAAAARPPPGGRPSAAAAPGAVLPSQAQLAVARSSPATGNAGRSAATIAQNFPGAQQSVLPPSVMLAAPGAGAVGSTAALPVGALMATMLLGAIRLAKEVVDSGERVVLNHERCRRIASRVSAMLPFLEQLYEHIKRPDCAFRGAEPQIRNIAAVYADCKAAVDRWCDCPSGLVGALRNMLMSQEYESTFMDLQERLTQCYIDLTLMLVASGVTTARQPMPKIEEPTPEQLQQDSDDDLHQMAERAMMQGGWDQLTPDERKKAVRFWAERGLDLSKLRKQERKRLRDEVLHDLLIPKSELDIKQRIGRGGYGVVHLATYHGTTVAVKIFHASEVTERQQATVENEAWIMSSLHHPNIVQLEGILLEDLTYAIVMKYYPNGSLHLLLHQEEPPTFARRLQFALHAARGVQYLHSRRKPIVHGDIKTSNMLVDESMRVVVSDFGVSRIISSTASLTTASSYQSSAMSLAFCAPELLASAESGERSRPTLCSDVYALGMVVFEIMALEAPFEECSPYAVGHRICQGLRPTIPATVPSVLTALIRRCWAQDPAQRPTSAEVLQQLEALAK